MLEFMEQLDVNLKKKIDEGEIDVDDEEQKNK